MLAHSIDYADLISIVPPFVVFAHLPWMCRTRLWSSISLESTIADMSKLVVLYLPTLWRCGGHKGLWCHHCMFFCVTPVIFSNTHCHLVERLLPILVPLQILLPLSVMWVSVSHPSAHFMPIQRGYSAWNPTRIYWYNEEEHVWGDHPDFSALCKLVLCSKVAKLSNLVGFERLGRGWNDEFWFTTHVMVHNRHMHSWRLQAIALDSSHPNLRYLYLVGLRNSEAVVMNRTHVTVLNRHMNSWHLHSTGYCTGLRSLKFEIYLLNLGMIWEA